MTAKKVTQGKTVKQVRYFDAHIKLTNNENGVVETKLLIVHLM